MAKSTHEKLLFILSVLGFAIFAIVNCQSRSSRPNRNPLSRVSRPNPAALRCEPVEVPMCKGLVPYNMTRLPNSFGHTTQSDVYWALQQWWPFMDMGCSRNFRLLLCGLYLPKCIEGQRLTQLPCRQVCKRAKKRCFSEMAKQNLPWTRTLRCTQFSRKRKGNCIPPLPERKKKGPARRHVQCQRNRLPMCSNVPYRFGSLPNMYLQSNIKEMKIEMAQYQPLIDATCSRYTKFFLCGVYMPFCLRRGVGQCEVPFVVPCREVCEHVQQNCGGLFESQRAGLPWPGKLHCHRYPSKNRAPNQDECVVSCVMPSDWQD